MCGNVIILYGCSELLRIYMTLWDVCNLRFFLLGFACLRHYIWIDFICGNNDVGLLCMCGMLIENVWRELLPNIGPLKCKQKHSRSWEWFTLYMCLVFPKLMPLCVAPLFEPYCSEITFWPARICSSLKFRTFLSASLGPIEGCPNVFAYEIQIFTL